MIAFGCYVVGRFTKFGPLYLSYGGLCALLWVPFFAPYASFMENDSNNIWGTYILFSAVLMFSCRLAARCGYNLHHALDCGGKVQIENIAEPWHEHGATDRVFW